MVDTKNLTASNGALRLQAYRKRLSETDLVRAEILLPKSVRDSMQSIAKQEDAKYLETVSALAQLGLETYAAQTTLMASAAPASLEAFSASLRAVAPMSESFGHSSNMAVCSAAAFTNTTASLGASPAYVSPLSRFLKNRKESADE